MTRTIAKAVMTAAVALSAGSTAAEAEFAYFRTPSANIYCAFDDEYDEPTIRCDIRNFTYVMPPRPADCDLDWGDSFVITANGAQGIVACHGDTVISNDAAPLAYGKSWTAGAILCISERLGLTCHNREGHGFFLSKANYRIF